jgi:FixJ family two-component response regulator
LTPHVPVVAVVDDHESVRLAIASLLRSLDLHVEAFASGAEFLGWPHLNSLTCVVLDVRMPGMSGFDVLRELAACGRQLPVILISAHEEPQARQLAVAAGALAFLSKPFPERSLLDPIRSAIGKARTVNAPTNPSCRSHTRNP